MAAPRKKPPVKKAPVKKAPVKKKPSFLRKDTPRPARDLKAGDLRSQTLTNDNKPRPARDLNKGGLRAQYLKSANAGGGSAVARGLIKKIPVVGAALGFIADAAPAGEGSTKDKYSTLKKKYSSAIGPTKPKASESSSSAQIGLNKPPRWREDASWKYNAPIGPKKKSASSSTYSGYGTSNVPKKSGSSDAFTLGSGAQTTGGNPVSRAAPKPNLRPRKVASSAPVARLSRTEREGLSTDRMQRKPKGNLLGFLKKRK